MSRSTEWFQRLCAVIPGGSSTDSKRPSFLPDEPGVIVKGKGCRVWDADGREFIDYRNGLGPVTLGYCFPAVDAAIRGQLQSGIVFGHPHPLECEVAEIFAGLIPCAERVRFLKTGGEAIAACIRLARCYTGRDHVVQIGYNGWLNSLARGSQILPGRLSKFIPPGVPEVLSLLHHPCTWNDKETLLQLFETIGDRIAAVVVAADYGQMAQGQTFYPFLRDLTLQHGSILIYDEIVTGFRVALGGVQEYFQVTPDMAVFAKGIANGMPLAVYCGKAEIMDKMNKAGVSSTYGGETLSLAAARATVSVYQEQNVVGHLWKMGELLGHGLQALFRDYNVPIQISGLWPCVRLHLVSGAPAHLEERFYRAAYRNGVSLYSVIYPNFSHQKADIEETLARLDKAMREL